LGVSSSNIPPGCAPAAQQQNDSTEEIFNFVAKVGSTPKVYGLQWSPDFFGGASKVDSCQLCLSLFRIICTGNSSQHPFVGFRKKCHQKSSSVPTINSMLRLSVMDLKV